MSDGYTKLFSSIIHSTVWQEDAFVKVVWITMLAMADRDGIVHASVPGLAKAAGVQIAACEAALSKFTAPDPYSRTADNEGRRVGKVDGGWELLNYAKYRLLMNAEDQAEKHAARQKRYRDKDKPTVTDRHEPSRVTPSAESDYKAEAEAEANTKAEARPDREPRKRGARAKPRALISEGFFPDNTGCDLADEAGWSLERIEAERKKFINHHQAKGTLFASPQAGWRTWVGRSADFERPSGTHATAPDRSSQSSPAFQRQLERIRKAEAEEKEAS